MRHYWLALPFVLASPGACSSSDQSLGETRAQPNPDPVVDPDPPDPSPVVPPCENMLLHSGRTGVCRPAGTCSNVLTSPGYECASGLSCCDMGVGCGAPPDPCSGTGAKPGGGGSSGTAGATSGGAGSGGTQGVGTPPGGEAGAAGAG